MKILLTSHYTLPHFGGIEVVVDRLGRGFAARGHRVTLMAARLPGQSEADEPEPGFHVLRVPAWNFLERAGVPVPLWRPSALRALRRQIAAADLIHSHGFLQPPTWMAVRLGRAAGVPVVLTEHAGIGSGWGPGIGRRLAGVVERWGARTVGRGALRAASCVTAVGPRVAAALSDLARRREAVVWIPNGVDTEVFRPVESERREALARELGIAGGSFRVLFIGRFHAKKGLDLLLAAELPGCERILVPSSGGLGSYGADRLRQSRVLEPRPQRELVRVYQACHALVLLSASEGGLPLVAQEAMACGLPVFLNPDPAYLEFTDSAAIELVERDCRALGRAVAALRGSPAEYQRRSRAARATAVGRFRWDRTVESYLGLFAALRSGGTIDRALGYRGPADDEAPEISREP